MSGVKIPETCGVIILPETVLFPHGALPLHIFEPRYRTMLEEALESHCMICVATAIADEEEELSPKDFTHSIGTVGLIRTSREMEDGRSNLVLHGVHRVHFRLWKTDKVYPTAELAPFNSSPIPFDEAPLRVSQLRDEVNATLSGFPIDVKKQINNLLDQAKDQPAILADAIAQQFVNDTELRLKLLSERVVANRFDLLSDYLKNALKNRRLN